MQINGNIRVKLRFATGEVLPSGTIWKLALGNKISVDVVIVALFRSRAVRFSNILSHQRLQAFAANCVCEKTTILHW